MSAARVQAGDILAGKYRVERVLGEGGMGIVVAAFHLALEQRVAVKFLRKDMADRGDAAERFRREARAVARIQSEHVARVLDVGSMDDGETYIVMEYLDGNDLAEELRQRGALPLDESIDIALQVADAVSDAHASGIVHRDLKPANVFLIRRPDGSRLAKVLDFGISKSLLVDSASNFSLTQTSTVMGSPLYMSPEQMRSARDVDGRTDIWALGAILYECLAGAPPHGGSSLPEICTSLLHDTPRPLETQRGDLPPGLSAVIMRCLAKDRADRFPSMRDFTLALLPCMPEGMTSAVHAAGTRVSSYGASTTGSRFTPAPLSPGARPSGRTPSGSTEAPASLTLSSQSELHEQRKARKVIFVGLFGAALLVAVLATIAFRMSGRGDDVAKGADGVPETPKVAAAGVAQGEPTAAVTSMKEPAPVPPASVEVASSPRKPIAEPVVTAAHAHAQAPATEQKPPVHVVLTKPHPQTESITDFGGRR
ncbi:MAG TPA: serine/threonine-protein kinase [Polyangiaceae bacterium]|jgi:serine/threonine-protein kinase|nr:serine/threonine-protein kinase [Polyangiaceae bacterium]